MTKLSKVYRPFKYLIVKPIKNPKNNLHSYDPKIINTKKKSITVKRQKKNSCNELLTKNESILKKKPFLWKVPNCSYKKRLVKLFKNKEKKNHYNELLT